MLVRVYNTQKQLNMISIVLSLHIMLVYMDRINEILGAVFPFSISITFFLLDEVLML